MSNGNDSTPEPHAATPRTAAAAGAGPGARVYGRPRADRRRGNVRAMIMAAAMLVAAGLAAWWTLSLLT